MEVLLAEKIGIGTWPDWIAACGSLLAFAGVTAGLLWEIRNRRLDAQDAKAAQARLVYAAVERVDTTTVRISNNSPSPIFDAAANVFINGKVTGSAFTDRVDALQTVLLPVGPPGYGSNTDRPGRFGGRAIDVPETPGVLIHSVGLTFVDASGSLWQRLNRHEARMVVTGRRKRT
ncbi:hypothetical protein KZZ52_44665 [Dactylosporangium sp. AC04546]|uniref:hypothetical protein n=1 Tax=Dactylosporangium sp. AC04546 TaxID=2862460 RepID=UPI001EE0ABCF|nr:hypothetical protein [Dactylosporangium sp. AC04546]WVK81009.1 hypothetical protein KZZ52_44665 [Dactylosporangium sp. AC04546]